VHDITLSDCTLIYHKVGAQIDKKTTSLTLNNVKLVELKAE
jgi:hypothetical protein